jgi:L,D-transpeptidase YcbB
MKVHKRVLFFLVVLFFANCKNKTTSTISSNTKVINNNSELNVADVLQVVQNNNGIFTDSSTIYNNEAVKTFYESKNNNTVWSKKSGLNNAGQQLHQFIEKSMEYGLFPEDYHWSLLQKLKSQLSDSSGVKVNKKAVLAQADILYTDAFLKIAEHLKKGRLAKDSITLNVDSTLTPSYYVTVLNNALKTDKIIESLNALEPTHKNYIAIKKALPSFIQQLDLKHNTYIVFPNKDSAALVRNVMQRLYEAGMVGANTPKPDSIFYTKAIQKYQQSKGLKVTGKPNEEFAKNLNTSDWYRFKRVAATLDRFKTLPAKLPETYVWVNLPSYKMQIMHHDTVAMMSKVIIGRTVNRTPVLNSAISNIVLYPTWTVPTSIALKEMLPIAKRNPGYFKKRGFKVLNRRGKAIDPYTINWSRYNKSVPFTFRQNEGGGNALGIIKFNFENPYAVYLHDTNQRYLFSQTNRALSHGCVRVQLWDSAARYLIKASKAYYPDYETVYRDSIGVKGDTISLSNTILKDSSFIVADSLKRYMAKKKNMALLMTNKIPIYIRYYGCDVDETGKLIFYNDIYSEDKIVIDKYFSKK